ncbi:hypothetical protein BDP67DRAFT_171453 [Colletotrichum lupini]|nr:hypothetical protein BDP67DRAFT_171453 [Colletotrichum lupini]
MDAHLCPSVSITGTDAGEPGRSSLGEETRRCSRPGHELSSAAGLGRSCCVYESMPQLRRMPASHPFLGAIKPSNSHLSLGILFPLRLVSMSRRIREAAPRPHCAATGQQLSMIMAKSGQISP